MRKALKTVLCVALVLALAVVIALRVLPPMKSSDPPMWMEGSMPHSIST